MVVLQAKKNATEFSKELVAEVVDHMETVVGNIVIGVPEALNYIKLL